MAFFKFQGGQFVRDQLTNVSGIVNGVIVRDTGNVQYSVVPVATEDSNELKDSFWIDADYLINDAEKDMKADHVDFNQTIFEYDLGDLVKSAKTEFKGTIYAKIVWITGCVSYCVTSSTMDRDGKQVHDQLDENECIALKEINEWQSLTSIVQAVKNFKLPRVIKPLRLKKKERGGPMSISRQNTKL